jgi:hypothetical protein
VEDFMKNDVPAASRIKVTLRDIRPPIWRRLEIGTNITFEDLHDILQIAMGWTDSHLHAFDVGTTRIGPSDPEWAEDLDEKRVFLRDVLSQGVRRFRYEYDFGDDWMHDIAVEALFEPEPGTSLPRCTAGKRSGPPEDSGGPWGYRENLVALRDADHPEHEEMAEWFPPEFDPEEFDIDAVNQRLQRMARRRPPARRRR